MPIESSRDFSSYVNPQIGGVSATFREVQDNLWDSRTNYIDTWADIDSGASSVIQILIDQSYFGIQGNSVSVEGYNPIATMKSTDVPSISQEDKITIHAITTNNGNVITPETTFFIKEVHPDNTGMVQVLLEAI